MATIKNERLGINILVDDELFEWLSGFTWGLDADGYAITTERLPNGKQRKLKMHRMIAKPQKGYMVDHINHDKLDNRLTNLRVCTNTQNQWNSNAHKDARSKFKGVHKITYYNRWQARINVNGERIDIGTFYYELEAAEAYNKASLKYHGEFSNINIFDKEETKTLNAIKMARTNELNVTEFRIMQFITRRMNETGNELSPSDIGEGIGFKSPRSIYKCLDILKSKGFITWDKTKHRTIKPLTQIPLVHHLDTQPRPRRRTSNS